MKTPREKYLNDPAFHRLVKAFEQFLEDASFDPSELSQACEMAISNVKARKAQQEFTDKNET